MITENSTVKEMVEETNLIKSDIVSCETNIKSILTKNKIEFTELEKMNELISKFDAIKPGRRVQVKDISDSSSTIKNYNGLLNNTIDNFPYLNVKLDFVPSIFICMTKDVGKDIKYFSVGIKGDSWNTDGIIMCSGVNKTETQMTSYCIKWDSIVTIYEPDFSYHIPMYRTSGYSDFTIIAIE